MGSAAEREYPTAPDSDLADAARRSAEWRRAEGLAELDEGQAMELAVEEVRAVRRERIDRSQHVRPRQ